MFAQFRHPAAQAGGVSANYSQPEPWPTELNPCGCGQYLHVAKDKLSVQYTGSGRDRHNNDVGCIQVRCDWPNCHARLDSARVFIVPCHFERNLPYALFPLPLESWGVSFFHFVQTTLGSGDLIAMPTAMLCHVIARPHNGRCFTAASPAVTGVTTHDADGTTSLFSLVPALLRSYHRALCPPPLLFSVFSYVLRCLEAPSHLHPAAG